MKERKNIEIDNLFIKHEIIKLKLITESIENPNKKFPTARQIAEDNGVSELTVKKVEKELAHKGYLISNKKGGTRATTKFAKEQVSSYITVKESFKGFVDTLLKNGFSKEDVMALVYDVLSKIEDNFSNIIYTEKDENIAIFAKREIEKKINRRVIFKPFETLKTELKNRILKNKIIVVPFFCYMQLESLSYESIKVIPIKAKHPLEGFSEINSLPFGSRIFYIAASKLDKENANSIYRDILKRRYKIYIYTQDEIFSNRHLLSFADVVVGYDWIIESEEFLLKGVKTVIKCNRFDDEEGMRIIECYLEKLEAV